MDYLLFISTFAAASYLPGINMMMALSLSLKFGYKKTLFMILGGTLGLGFVSLVCSLGASAIIINHPNIFKIIKILGGIYIIYLSFEIFLNASELREHENLSFNSNLKLLHLRFFLQGFVICNTNPKAWIFIATLLPPFLDKQNPINSKMFLLIFIIMLIEFISYNTYAIGGVWMKHAMKNKVKILERISAILMLIVGIWIILKP
ncbi:LysE family translocator [Campylobacter ureolyticus]|uniref:LysE family translocator n=1 Tax=Campylobacter ureolyticus TaxID=827 RepID=UPI0022B558C3|nr:LysE family translocator [Campylobacter ureolyticus]MCZ6168493.1 LysE family translocator [Campylobacter ureolyticus]